MDNAALIRDVIEQQIHLEMQEMRDSRGMHVTGLRSHYITILQGQLAFYVGAAKAESIVMNLYMERMSECGGANSTKVER